MYIHLPRSNACDKRMTRPMDGQGIINTIQRRVNEEGCEKSLASLLVRLLVHIAHIRSRFGWEQYVGAVKIGHTPLLTLSMATDLASLARPADPFYQQRYMKCCTFGLETEEYMFINSYGSEWPFFIHYSYLARNKGKPWSSTCDTIFRISHILNKEDYEDVSFHIIVGKRGRKWTTLGIQLSSSARVDAGAKAIQLKSSAWSLVTTIGWASAHHSIGVSSGGITRLAMGHTLNWDQVNNWLINLLIVEDANYIEGGRGLLALLVACCCHLDLGPFVLSFRGL